MKCPVCQDYCIDFGNHSLTHWKYHCSGKNSKIKHNFYHTYESYDDTFNLTIEIGNSEYVTIKAMVRPIKAVDNRRIEYYLSEIDRDPWIPKKIGWNLCPEKWFEMIKNHKVL